MPPYKPSLPPLDMPSNEAAPAAEPSAQVQAAATPQGLKDYALAAAMGRQLSEPLGDMQTIVQPTMSAEPAQEATK